MSLPDDLKDYKLATEFQTDPDVILHRSYRADWARGRQKVLVVEKWAPQKPPLGAGSFGTVRLEKRLDANNHKEHTYRAVKQLRKSDMTRLRIDYRKELVALTKFSRAKFVQSQAFVNFSGWFENHEYVFIAMEYFQHGTLDMYIKNTLSEDDARIISLQLLEGLKIMHEEQFAHRDLKPQNIFIAQTPKESMNWWVKIGDFGISKRVANDQTALRTSTGTPRYLAPEVYHYVYVADEESDVYTNAVDIWSFACVVYEMMALRTAFPEWPRNLVTYCNGGVFPAGPLLARTSNEGIEFVKKLLVPNPAIRPTAAEALEFPWLQTGSVMDQELELYEPSQISEHQTRSTEGLDLSQMTVTQLPIRPNLVPTEISSTELSQDYGTFASDSETVVEFRDTATQDISLVTCQSCGKRVTGKHYHCSICDYSLCQNCVVIGRLCYGESHFLIKRHFEDEKGPCNFTETSKTIYNVRDEGNSQDETPKSFSPPLLSVWRPTRKAKGKIYDYCYQCRLTFPIDEEPARHDREEHGQSETPPQEWISLNEPTIRPQTWIKQDDESEVEAQALHEEKIRKMEAEMQLVFTQKVHDKEQTLKVSEEELYKRYTEMNDALKVQLNEMQERKDKAARLENGASKEKKRFTLFRSRD